MKKTFYFATSNSGKFLEAKDAFEKAGLKLKQLKTELLEIQSDSLEEIALISAREAFKKFRKPLFVEDAGLFIKSLNEFPGPYSKHAFFTLGPKGILKLLEDKNNRSAEFVSAIAYISKNKENVRALKSKTEHMHNWAVQKVFKGVCKGSISHSIKGKSGFGFDPIFIPKRHNKTFAQDFEFKKKVSHRAQSLQKLIKWLSNN